MKITVHPSDNIFAELGHNTYDYKDLLSELIDNSIAARIQGELLRVRIEIEVDKDLRPLRFIIWDDASGIPRERLGPAIAPAGLQTQGSLNEHGLGMKQAVAALGRLKSLVTKTADQDSAVLVPEFRFGEIDADEITFDRARGTTITVEDLKPIVVTNATSYTRTIVPYLGARYRRFLRPENAAMSLVVEVRGADGASLYKWEVKEVKPTYFHPGTRENRPVFSKYPIEGNGWKAELTFGYAPKDNSEYEELGLEAPTKFHPYRVSISTQGLDVILHDRVILFHQLSELAIVNQRHSDYNAVRGEIVLLNGFSTAITKNSIIQDDPFRGCIVQVRDILTGEKAGPAGRKENYVQHKSYPEELPEALLRDRLVEWLTNNPIQKRQNVSKEYAVAGVEGFIDILADGEAWELKKDQASALDVYQLFMYMDIGDINKGYLVAKTFTPGASVAVKAIKEKHNKEIVAAPRDQFPINHQPTAQEREDYY
ncbi:MAG: ATP-binding protein [Terriglobales bacterium]|jgi:hypothetical protein